MALLPDSRPPGTLSPHFMQHPWRREIVGTYTIPFLFLMEEWSSVNAPFFLVPMGMLATTSFLWTAAGFYPHLDYFFKDTIGLNLNLRNLRPAFKIAFVCKTRFGNPSSNQFKIAPLKVLAIEGQITADVIAVLKTWERKPVLLVDGDADITGLLGSGIQVIRSHRVTTPELTTAIRNTLASSESRDEQDLLADIKRRVSPNHGYILESRPLDSSGLPGTSLKKPTLLLLQRRYRGHLPDASLVDASNVELCELYDALVEREYKLDEYRHSPASAPVTVMEGIKCYQADPSTSAFLDMVGDVEVEEPMVARNGLIIDLPCVRPSFLQENLTARVNERVAQSFYKAWESEVVPPPNRNLLSSEEEVLVDLTSSWNAVEDFVGASIALFANDEQAAVIRLPKCSSKLFRGFQRVREAFNRKLIVRNLRTRKSEVMRDTPAFNRELSAFREDLAKAFPSDVLEYLAKVKTGVRVISDLPVEWLLVNGVPLNFRAKVSRLPRTRGNGLLAYAGQGHYRHLVSKKEASSLLIINCLDDDDSLAGLPNMLSAALSRATHPHHYEKVGSFQEYQEVLNRHKPFILIHIGHGKYLDTTDECVLQFGKTTANMNNLSDSVCIPEIVLFGACETASIDTDQTPARAYLSFGSCAVLASLLEISGIRTMMFFNMVIDILWIVMNTENRRTVTWGDVVKDAQSRAHFQDIVSSYVEDPTSPMERVISSEMVTLFQQEYLSLIENNQLDVEKAFRDGPQLLIDSVRRYSAEEAASLSKFLKEDRVHWNSALYTHYGMPENIIIAIER